MIKISDDFPIVDLATWQEVASKSLKLESYEALENKLNKQTCEGLILKSYYSREVPACPGTSTLIAVGEAIAG